MLSGVKTTDVAIAFVGETVTYMIQVVNIGTTPAENTVLIETLPLGTSLVPGSILVDNLPLFGTNPSAIELGTIPPGGTVTISLEFHINNLPNPPEVINRAILQYEAAIVPDGPLLPQPPVPIPPHILPIVSPNLDAALSADRTVTAPGDVITYSVTATNTGNTLLSSVTVLDPPPAGTQLVQGSVAVNGAPQAGADPANGISVGNLSPAQSVTVTYQVRVLSAQQAISNEALISFVPDIPGRTVPARRRATNRIVIPALLPNLSLVKLVSQTEAALGDAISYTLIATNTGNTSLSDVTIIDPPPDGTVLIPGSAVVNGIPQAGASPATGILSSPVLSPDQSVNVVFQVRVTTSDTAIVNLASAVFTPVIPGLVLPSQQRQSNQVETTVIDDEE